jgi:hypothetical protein
MGILPSLRRHFDDQYSPRIAGSAEKDRWRLTAANPPTMHDVFLYRP